ncbi:MULTISPECIES: AAA family ATPase [unclassified Butyrivibrio]|uniref:AAA family ATPase n=1 Tax=unclassified Butyrivibrio TaxID=2639466 RepID=UPI0003FF93F6|nr:MULTISPECIES: AAA family ATPase [unclassified Butyrivibrio]SEM11596.1 Predicted ATPase [Butyrivibrio sp. ob235]
MLDEMCSLPIQGVSINWDKIDKRSYLRGIEAIKDLDYLSFNKNITIFVGENGSGKSTVLEAIAVNYGFNPEGGTKNYSFSTYDSHSELCDAIRLSRGVSKPGWGYFLRAESFYNVATAEEMYSREDPRGIRQQFHERSHGESFLQLVQTNFKGHGLYLLDEPEAALSPQRQLTLLIEIVNCAKEDSQFIMVTHSPILLGIPGAEILSFDDGQIHPIEYEDTDSYQITKMFIENKEQLLKRLLSEE